MKLNKLKGFALVPAAAILIAGCAVKPKEITYSDTADYGKQIRKTLGENQEPVTKPVTLSDAIARAIKYNHDRRLQVMRVALSKKEIANASFDMLPKLTASAGYTERNKDLASYSQIVDGSISNSPSYSQERGTTTADLTLSWNILDFGLSYVRAQQTADKYLISQEEKRKVLQNIVKDVVRAYYKAVSADKLLRNLESVKKDVNEALENSRTIAANRFQSPLDALSYQKELMDILRSLQTIERDLRSARSELASLMGMTPGQAYKLNGQTDFRNAVVRFNAPIGDMELTALTYRPEIVQTYYQERITAREIQAGVISVLPGIRLSAGQYYSSNDYLVNNNWNELGAQVSWNLFNIFKIPTLADINELKKAVEEQQRLAVSMAVVTQVHISRAEYAMSVKDYNLAGDYREVEAKIFDQIKQSESVGKVGTLRLIREKLNMLLADLRRDVAYADLKNSYIKMFVSMGMDPVPADANSESVDTLADAVSARLAEWDKGNVELVSANDAPEVEAAPETAPEVVPAAAPAPAQSEVPAQ